MADHTWRSERRGRGRSPQGGRCYSMEELGGVEGENSQDVRIWWREQGSPAWGSRRGICRVGSGGFGGGTARHVLLALREEHQGRGGGRGPLFWQDPAGDGRCAGRDLCGGERDPYDAEKDPYGGWDLEPVLASLPDHKTPRS